MPHHRLALVRRPLAPLPVPGDDPRWGDPAVAAGWGPAIATDVVDSVTHATNAERVSITHPLRSGPIPLPLRLPFVLARPTNRQPFDIISSTDQTGFARPNFQLRYQLSEPLVRLLNHPGGMRGHYAVSPQSGDAFTADLITRMLRLLLGVAADWHEPGHPAWMDEEAMTASLGAGKVWVEPAASAGDLVDHQAGNPGWVRPGHPTALARRQGFIAEVRRREGSDARRDAFLTSAAAASGGMMGVSAHFDGANWGIQDAGARWRDASGATLQVSGAFINAAGDIWTPLRKTHRALSIHWFGFT